MSTASPGRQVLVAVYAVFALAAGARAVVQLATKADLAPLAYSLSLLAALVYLVATIALRRPGASAYRVALAAVTFELVGVLVVGTLTVVDGGLFPDQTVWSSYGVGYGFVPLLLPVAGVWWLLRHRPAEPTPVS
ncbi:MAG: hypothetical protein ABIQ15_13190 [Nocardioides sp.]